MIDLGHTYYEQKKYFFNELAVHQIIINPDIKGYPPIFMLCREQRGSQQCEYILGATFLQLNRLMMMAISNKHRLLLAERLAESLMPGRPTDNISLKELIGQPLNLSGLDITTVLHRFHTDPRVESTPLYYFQLNRI